MGAASYFARVALAGATCCCVTHSALVPLDVVKTRLQLEPGRYTGFRDAARSIVRAEGATGLLVRGWHVLCVVPQC